MIATDHGYAAARAAQRAQEKVEAQKKAAAAVEASGDAPPIPAQTARVAGQRPPYPTPAEARAQQYVPPSPAPTTHNRGMSLPPSPRIDPTLYDKARQTLRSPSPQPGKSSTGNKIRGALLGEDHRYYDNDKDDWADRRDVAQDRNVMERHQHRAQRQRSGSVTSVASSIKSALKSLFGSSSSRKGSAVSARSNAKGESAYHQFVAQQGGTINKYGICVQNLPPKEQQKREAREQFIKSKISRPIPDGPVMDADHIEALATAQNKQRIKAVYQRRQQEGRDPKSPTHKTMIVTGMIQPEGVVQKQGEHYLRYNDFAGYKKVQEVVPKSSHHQRAKESFDKALEHLHLRRESSTETFFKCDGLPKDRPRACNGCGRKMRRKEVGGRLLEGCEYCECPSA